MGVLSGILESLRPGVKECCRPIIVEDGKGEKMKETEKVCRGCGHAAYCDCGPDLDVDLECSKVDADPEPYDECGCGWPEEEGRENDESTR